LQKHLSGIPDEVNPAAIDAKTNQININGEKVLFLLYGTQILRKEMETRQKINIS